MRGASSSLFTGLNDYSQSVTLKIWWKTGSAFEEIFSIDRSTFSDVKSAAIRYFDENDSSKPLIDSPCCLSSPSTNPRTNVDAENYKLISIESKRVVDEKQTLNEAKVKEQDEFLLVEKKTSKVERPRKFSSIDEKLIDSRTEKLERAENISSQDFRLANRTEFRADLNCILITLIEAAQKLLWCHPDAENIFRQAEEILTKSSDEDPNSTTDRPVNVQRDLICKLMEMGFTERQSQIALNKTKNDLHAAMELILTQPDLSDDEPNSGETNEQTPLSLFNRQGPFLSFRQFRKRKFQPNQRAVQSLKDMGFNEDDVLEALRRFNNDQNLACEFLLSDRQQQETILATNNDQCLEPNSAMFQSIMENPIVQRALNNPKTFFVMLKIADNPTTIGNYLNDPDIGNMLLQISRIYHAERDQVHPSIVNRTTTDNFQTRLQNETD